MRAEAERSHNLSLADYARLARMSRQQVYRAIAARRLLSLDIGRRIQRVPDWQLTSPGLGLTRAVLKAADCIDSWTLYSALIAPAGALHGRSAVASVTRANLDAITCIVLDSLGLQEAATSPVHIPADKARAWCSRCSPTNDWMKK